MRKVFLLEASQGQWSDYSHWVVGVYGSLQAVFDDPGNSNILFKQVESHYGDVMVWRGEEKKPDDYEPIGYVITEWEVQE